ncbi:hypothetical protein CTAYLR_002409 [Chrysophaeum taylorii]|uniref:Glycosyltransferase 61 catalytic domain-containing protein n=1 Tax=Chrysophaeum taylorii TaxID=2483200 RepID=A0AAD7UIT2_9STRA|nr:hypothetical protein CTAYLR_002409 [Chrysophaeum taylorii]
MFVAAAVVRACVRSAPNPEFASSPSNYAHWMLAHAYPTIVALRGAEVERVVFPLVHGENEGLRLWARQYADLLGWPVEFADEAAVVTLAEGSFEVPFDDEGALIAACERHDLPASACAQVRAATTGGTAIPACAVTVSIAVPHLAFCTATHWRDLASFQDFVRSRFPPKPMTPRVVVLLRADADRDWDVKGLEKACARRWPGVDVSCESFSRATRLREVARALGDARVLVAPHGAALANCVFLPPGARVFELDAHAHRHFHRFFYQDYARGLGLSPSKVWLDDHGRRYDVHPNDLRNCTMYHDNGTQILGHSKQALRAARILDYTHPILLTDDILNDLVSAALGQLG